MEKLADVVRQALKDPAVAQYYDLNDNTVLELGPDKLPDFIAKEKARFKGVVERSGATAD